MVSSTRARFLGSRTLRRRAPAARAERHTAPRQSQTARPCETKFVVCESTIFQRFRRLSHAGVFEALSGDPDFEYALIDGTIVRVHQHGTGAKGGLRIRPSGARAAV
jgi:hypothetical protein